MSNALNVRMKAYIQPFERELAMRELAAVTQGRPEPATSGTTHIYKVATVKPIRDLVERLAYWELAFDGENEVVTKQSLREATVNVVRNGIGLDALKTLLPFGDDVPLPNRRCLRYGTHGIHEYRGKFFPQLVRALINISGAPFGGVVADPMSGSGTTAVEAMLAGYDARGLDMNPLSVMLGNTKCDLLSANPDSLAAGYSKIREELLKAEPHVDRQLVYFKTLPPEDQNYLSAWFSEDVLASLDDIYCAISCLSDRHARALCRIALSNIIRSVSWQKNDDLRVRKEVRLDVEIDPKKEFLEELGSSVRAVLAFLYQETKAPQHQFEIVEGDARDCGGKWGADTVDVIITSPPYATALPYLDTDRLSLCYLGLLPRPEHRSRDQRMIGNREVTDKLRRSYWERYQAEGSSLPASVRDLIDRIDMLNAGTNVGFRRKNLPALLSKYFFDMKDVIAGMKYALKPGSYSYVVVGNNHTIAGGHRVDIRTAQLLADIAALVGFEVEPSLSMEMLVSRDLFKKNAMASEEILAFRKPI
jgi:site-specific DNA-methyltransferase (cytosine-N4-specific)